MRKILIIVVFLISLPMIAGSMEQKTEFTVLQWNIWQEGTMVPGGYDAIVDEIERLRPDFVTFSEVRNYHGTRFCDRIVASLRERGLEYYSFYSYDSGLLSRYPITDSTTVFPENGDHGSIYRMVSEIGGREIAVYTAHLDYLNDAYYNVRGYDGSTWEKIPIPQTVLEVLQVNDASQRDDAIREFIAAAGKDIEAGRIVILGGDFNEPSHLDWTWETKDLYDHNGLIIPWTVPLMLDNAGYIDTYREQFPDVLSHPGFTFPADNPLIPVERLTWTPDADERDRIDYIFYYPYSGLELLDVSVFGPRGSISNSQRVTEATSDPFIEPLGVWPTDHKGVLARFAVTSAEQEIPLKYGADRIGKRQDPAMQRFRDNRLGAFIHWGLYAIPGGVWDGKTYSGAAEWLESWADVPSEEWMKLMKQWNPENFDAREWARMFKEMGVKYVKITTKHHEGFCLWPSKYSEYTVARTPYRKDILGELVDAFGEEGIDVHFYFSVMDWSHPDWRYDIKTPEDSVAFSRFLEFTDNQLRELATRYPSVKDFWFDGTWDASVKKNAWWTAHAEKMLKELVPGVTVNSRLRADDYGKRHFDSNGHLMGDYESGYERRLPDPVKDLQVTQWDWEACMTVPENQWGYHRDWSLSYVKTPAEVLERIIHAVAMGGNMAVNFGPQPDGDFRPEEKALASYIGQWMKRYGQCVYGCDYAGWDKQDWGWYTTDGEYVYMIVFNAPYSSLLTVKTPKDVSVESAVMMDGGRALEVIETARNEYNVRMPSADPGEPFVIRLETGGSAGSGNKYRDALI